MSDTTAEFRSILNRFEESNILLQTAGDKLKGLGYSSDLVIDSGKHLKVASENVAQINAEIATIAKTIQTATELLSKALQSSTQLLSSSDLQELLTISKRISQDQAESSGSIRAEIGGTNQSVQQLISDIKPIWGLLESEKSQNKKLSDQLEKIEAEHSALKSKIAMVPEKKQAQIWFGLREYSQNSRRIFLTPTNNC